VDEPCVRRLARAVVFTTLLLASAIACGRKERHGPALPTEKAAPSGTPSASSARTAPSTRVTAIPSGRGARVRQMFVTNEFGETTCSQTDFGETFRGRLVITDREVYSFPKMNAHLRKYPEFATAMGLTEVKDCDDARRYAERYDEYRQAHPDFDLEGPTKEEQFKEFLSDPDNIAKPGGGSR